jgi:hypothetical protein
MPASYHTPIVQLHWYTFGLTCKEEELAQVVRKEHRIMAKKEEQAL